MKKYPEIIVSFSSSWQRQLWHQRDGLGEEAVGLFAAPKGLGLDPSTYTGSLQMSTTSAPRDLMCSSDLCLHRCIYTHMQSVCKS